MRWLKPEWQVAPSVQSLSTLRTGGLSRGRYQGFNLATHVQDEPTQVEAHRRILQNHTGIQAIWLNQVHSADTLALDRHNLPTEPPAADGFYLNEPGIACAVLTADCLPILLCDDQGTEVAALHAGWRGLSAGIIDRGLSHFKAEPDRINAWLGPCISAPAYEVDDKVRDAFLALQPALNHFFVQNRVGHYQADLQGIAAHLLQQAGVRQITSKAHCTYQDLQCYSHRRQGLTGRMASLIWLEPNRH